MAYKPAFKAARAIKGITQESAASLLGVATSTLSKWESGETEPTASQLYKMSVMYDITVDRLIGLERIV